MISQVHCSSELLYRTKCKYNLFLTSFHIWPISSDNMPFELKDFQLYGGLVHAVNIIRRKLLFVWMFSLGPSILFLFIDFQIMVFKVKFIFSMDISIVWQTAIQSTKCSVSNWKNGMIKYFKIYFRYKKPARNTFL